jgi:hypothetical protein
MVGVTTPLFSDYFSYGAPRRARRLAADEAAAEEARPDPIIGPHEQPDLRQPGRHAPPARPVGAGPVEPPGNDR